MPTQAERTETTRAALIAAGRNLFGATGFAATSVEDLAAAAGVTRGALYHHFDSKEDLFAAVFEGVETELMAAAGRGAVAGTDAWDRLRLGCRAFLEACGDPAIQRIALLDAPAALGIDRWREIEERYALEAIRMSLEMAMREDQLPTRPPDVLAHLLLSALNEGAMLIAREQGRVSANAVMAEIDALLDGLRAPAPDLQPPSRSQRPT
jgi:AcrR family transcriptional regulator